jgi:hypothetical protein
MEKKDYSNLKNIKIDELQIKFIDTKLLENYTEIFQKNNITTLEDLLIKNDENTFNSRKQQENITIKGMCDLLKYVYLKQPLEQGIHLEDKIEIDNYTLSETLRRLGFFKKEEMIIRNFYSMQTETLKIIDILKLFFYNTQYQEKLCQSQPLEYTTQEIEILNNLNTKILYITNYYKKNHQENIEEKLDELNQKRQELLNKKQEIEKELELIEKQIILNGGYENFQLKR